MKLMTDFIYASSDAVKSEILNTGDGGQNLEVNQLFSKFSMDTVASCAFGVDAGSFKKGDETPSPFITNAKGIFEK